MATVLKTKDDVLEFEGLQNEHSLKKENIYAAMQRWAKIQNRRFIEWCHLNDKSTANMGVWDSFAEDMELLDKERDAEH